MAILTVVTLPLLNTPKQAYATHCADATHCYALEHNAITNYGNSFTTIITDMSMTTPCSYVLTVEQWIYLPNGDWMEQGFTIGGFIDQACVNNSEVSFHATRISGTYHDYNDGSVTVGQTKWYELSDENKDKVWNVKIDGSSITTITIPYTSGIGQDVGTETSHHSPTLPKTHVYDVAMLKTTGWAYWATGDFQQESPMWIINCTPNYKHVHVGSGTTGNCL